MKLDDGVTQTYSLSGKLPEVTLILNWQLLVLKVLTSSHNLACSIYIYLSSLASLSEESSYPV